MNYRLHRNGQWDILGNYVQVLNAYPAVNGARLSPVNVSVGDDFIMYQLETGQIRLDFFQRDGRVEVRCSVCGLRGIHDIELFADAAVENAENAFVQGFGMEGPSGCRSVRTEDKKGKEKELMSNGLIALFNDDGAFFVYALDHRHYVNRYCVGTCEKMFADESVYLSGGFNLENTAGDELTLPAVYFTEEKTLFDGLQNCAGKIAENMGARTTKPPVFHWCSWYYLYQNLSQEILEEYLAGFRKAEKDAFRYIQIDAGYTPHLGDWLLPNHLFPEGLEKAAKTILDAGYEAGVWIAPFIVGDQSELFKTHPDWILRDLEGRPVTRIQSYNEPKVWGSIDCNYYVLDTSHPDALSYLEKVFRTLKAWGFSLFKTDFMLWNMYDTSKVRRYDSSLTSVEILRNTLKMIREAIGEESYLLGCIAPFLPFIGYADGMRIAGDVGAQWAEDYGPVNMLRELQADTYFNHIYWQNDPDSVLLRDFAIHLQPHEIYSLALLQALSGGAVTTSDPIHEISEERRELLHFITPREKVRPQLPYFGQEREDIVLLHRLKQGNLLYAMNPTDRPLTVVYRFQEFFQEKEWYIRTYGGNASEKSELYTTILKPHDCVLLFLTRQPLERVPENLWEW